MSDLLGKIAIVTGGSRGVGRGIALELAAAGASVYVTGRSAATAFPDAPANLRPMQCNHTKDAEVEAVFERIMSQTGRIDILVNNVWGGSGNSVEDGVFNWGLPFWQQRMSRWDSMFAAGVRAHYLASALAAPAMVQQRSGLIVNLSYWAAQAYFGNVAYGVAKAATDKLSHDMAEQLREHAVTSLTLYPGLVRTEQILELADQIDLSNSESPQFVGRAVAALATDENVFSKSGTICTTADLAIAYGFIDVDGRQPTPATLSMFRA